MHSMKRVQGSNLDLRFSISNLRIVIRLRRKIILLHEISSVGFIWSILIC